MIGSISASTSAMKVANVLSDPAKPAIIEVSTMLSSGPGFPARKDPRLPLRRQLSMLLWSRIVKCKSK
eukprot:scaffold14691_cov193-Alexandrium_tamarense.AAC.8